MTHDGFCAIIGDRMVDVLIKEIRRNWTICQNEDGVSRWSALYATINPSGHIVLNRAAHEALQSPQAVHLLYDKELQSIGVRAAHPGQKNAFRLTERGSFGGRRIRGHKMMKDFGIYISETVQFPRCHINRDGIMILSLLDTRPISRKRRQKSV